MPTQSNLTKMASMTEAQLQAMKNSSGKVPQLAGQLIFTDEEDVNLSQLRCETLYDYSSSDSALNWGYTNGLYPSLGTITKDFSKYYCLIVSCKFDNKKFKFISDIGVESVFTGGGAFPRADGVQLFEVGVAVNTNSFAVVKIGYTNGSSFSDRNGSIGYYVYKIEGIIKQPAMIYTGEELTAGNGITINNGTISSNFSCEKLWVNPNTETSFTGQTISLNLSQYTYVLIEFRWETTDIYFDTQLTRVGIGGYIGAPYTLSNRLQRYFRVVSSAITFDRGNKGGGYDDSVCIPSTIYGIKGIPAR